MGTDAIFDSQNWRMPFHFWSAMFFVLGTAIGSFLNVCIHRMPIGESIVSPPSHCPHCRYSIPWFLNIPLVTWLYLRGKCANCGAPISIRYFLVELLTGVMFLGCWLVFGHTSPVQAVIYCVFLSGLIAASFIDFEHFIIPDEITIGGMVVGAMASFLVPSLHRQTAPANSLVVSVIGMLAGAGIIYGIVRGGKLLFGKQHVELQGPTRVIFGEHGIHLPDREISFEELFYRETDTVKLSASRVELCDRCYGAAEVSLTSVSLKIGDEEMKPEDVPFMEVTTEELELPREAMGLGDVKFMAAIGAFLGWQAVVFSLALSSFLGAVVGLTMMALKKFERGRQVQYGPYISIAAVAWIFGGQNWWYTWVEKLWAR